MKGKELKDIIKNSGIKIAELVTQSGINEFTLYSLYKKDTVESHYLEKLKKTALKLNTDIFKLEGKPYYDVDATAGNVTIFNGETPELIKEYINIPSFASCQMFVNVKGHSMYPKYQSGDIIGLIPIEDMQIIQYGESYLIVTKDSQRMIKTIRKNQNKDLITLHNENEKFDDFELPLNKILKLFLIKGPIRDGVMG